MAGPIASKLTEREKQCLRLVGRGLTSKEIAAELGVSPGRVDNILDAAREKLAASTRRRAALQLADEEAQGWTESTVAPVHLPGPPPYPSPTDLAEEAPRPDRVMEDRPPFGTPMPQGVASDVPPDLGWPWREKGSAFAGLSRWQVVVWIVMLSTWALIALAAVAWGLGALNERIVLQEHRPASANAQGE